jgi:adenine-specific DNA-methyltransferase
MMLDTQLNGESFDLISENVSKLKKLFPDIVTEDKIDFDKLKAVLGNYTETDSERYNFTWKGKANALRLAQTPSTGTLRPCKEESKNWDTTKNLYIEGDNLEVLKLLQKSYYGKIKTIYIDPPYNTGKEFVYPDDYKDNLQNYLEMTGQIDNDGLRLSTNADTSGRYHTNWLNMMYPRLRLARNLLSVKGLIFVSIDDNELSNLTKLMDEIFGEENRLAIIAWEKRFTRSNNARLFASNKDSILVYRKTENVSVLREPRTEKSDSIYSNPDNDTRGPWTSVSYVNPANKSQRPNLVYKIQNPISEKFVEHPTHAWKFSKKQNDIHIKENRLFWGLEGNHQFPRLKKFLSEVSDGLVPIDVWNHKDTGTTDEGTKELKSLFENRIFDNPKPVSLLKRILKIGTVSDDSDIIMDFFSGSATTAQGVMELNAEDNGNRKFILIQLPEPTSEKDEAYKANYKNICEIGQERIRRAGDKILSEMEKNEQTSLNSGKKNDNQLDIGFKVFKLDSSNLSKWDPEYENIEQSLLHSVNNLVPDRIELDLIYEIMLKYGIDLTLPIEEYKVYDGKIIYSIGFGALLICLNDNLDVSIATEILKLKEELSPEIIRVVFKDNGFVTDSDKTNIKETLKTHGIDEFVTI